MFGNNTTGKIIRIKDISELNLKKIKPSDLNNIYIDEKGQEYKLRYDPVEKRVKIIKVIKGKLDGTFVKSKYEEIAEDKKASVYVKYKIAEISKEKLIKPEDKISQPVQQTIKPEKPQSTVSTQTQQKSGKIKTFQDIFPVMENINNLLKIIEKNIFDSNVLSEKYSYDDKLILDDISRILNSDIPNEFRIVSERREDIMKGYEDTRLATKLYDKEVKKIIETKSAENLKEFLRTLEIYNIFITGFENILKAIGDVQYKLNTIPKEKITSRPFHERQKFEDACFLLNNAKTEIEEIFNFLKNEYNKLIS